MEKAVVNGKELESTSPAEPKVVYTRHLTTPEERKRNIQKEFKSELGRELTKKELEDYIYLFNKGYTNFWIFLRKIQEAGKNNNQTVTTKSPTENQPENEVTNE